MFTLWWADGVTGTGISILSKKNRTEEQTMNRKPLEHLLQGLFLVDILMDETGKISNDTFSLTRVHTEDIPVL